MLRRIIRTLLVEFPLALVFLGGFAYFHVTQATAVEMASYFVIALGVIGVVETLIHEGGHILCGLWYGVPLLGIQIGAGPAVKLWQNSAVPVSLGLLSWGGHVKFRYLPLSRRQRIVMYAGGVGASCIAAVIAWNVIPDHLDWLRTETAMAFGLFSLTNLFGTAPKDTYTDGDAIRGLLAYR